jgi:hypothetical protein
MHYIDDFALNVSRGLVKGANAVHVLGYNGDIDIGSDPETIWSYGGVYPWSSLTAANTVYVVSANTSDTMNLVIEGLDSNYLPQTETIVLDGTTHVATTKKFLRINDAYTYDTNPNVGAITFKLANTSGTVVDHIPAGYGHNVTGIYTIPANKTGYLYLGDCSSNLNKNATVVFRGRQSNSSFQVMHVVELTSGSYGYKFPFPPALPPKTDLEVYAINVYDNNTRITCNFDILLIDTPYGNNASGYLA